MIQKVFAIGLMLLYALALVLFLSSVTNAQTPDPSIQIAGSPPVQLVPLGGSGYVQVKVTVPRDDRNRVVCVALNGPVFRSSCYGHVAQTGAYRQEWAYKDLLAGEYDLVGELQWVGADGRRQVSYSRTKIVIRNPSVE